MSVESNRSFNLDHYPVQLVYVVEAAYFARDTFFWLLIGYIRQLSLSTSNGS